MVFFSESKIPKEDLSKFLFERGKKLCWSIYALSIIFFVAWFIAKSKESVIIANSTPYSQFFFFINPNILVEYIINGNLVSWLMGAVTYSSFAFLIAYLVALFSFVSIFILCSWLFIISYKTSIKYFQYIACLGIVPIFGVFLITYFVVKLMIFSFQSSRSKESVFAKDFEPEVFDDPLVKDNLDINNLSNRPINVQFTYEHYEKVFVPEQKKDLIRKLYDWLDSKLS